MKNSSSTSSRMGRRFAGRHVRGWQAAKGKSSEDFSWVCIDAFESSVARLKLVIDCRQDVAKLLDIGRETLLKENRNTLTVNFIDGYCNEP